MLLWRVLKVFMLLIALCLFLCCASPVIWAADGPIQVDACSNVLSFPKAIDFKLTAHDQESPLARAVLYITYQGLAHQEAHQVNVPSAHSSYTFVWHDDLTANSEAFPPIGAQISYYWVILDQANNSYTDPTQTLQVEDDRFHWQHLTRGLYQVNWYDQGTDFGQMVLGKVDAEIQSISHNLGGGLHHQINLWIYKNTDDFQSSLPPKIHEWVGGIAFPGVFEASIVVTSANDPTLQRDMPHELTHLLFHQLVAPTIAPIWFDEGLAVYNQNFRESDMTVHFKTALNDHNLLPLNTIAEDFPADADKAYLAYAQSWQLVQYLYQTFGLQKMAMLIKDMANPSQSFDDDLRQALGLDAAHLENQWHISLGQSPTLSKAQMSEPFPAPVSPTPPNPYDRRTLAILLIGVGLVFVSLMGLGSIVIIVTSQEGGELWERRGSG